MWLSKCQRWLSTVIWLCSSREPLAHTDPVQVSHEADEGHSASPWWVNTHPSTLRHRKQHFHASHADTWLSTSLRTEGEQASLFGKWWPHTLKQGLELILSSCFLEELLGTGRLHPFARPSRNLDVYLHGFWASRSILIESFWGLFLYRVPQNFLQCYGWRCSPKRQKFPKTGSF